MIFSYFGACRTDNIFTKGCLVKIKQPFVLTKQPLVKIKRRLRKMVTYNVIAICLISNLFMECSNF
ncbi:MAG: hypothetical protein LBL74_06810 [Bacteroidales bacterium]|nr:hypothetical protein [Bacteroidales bacterium]